MAKGGFSDVFKFNRNRNFHRTVLAYVNQMFQQISGINIITYYAATIFENDIGLSGFLSRLLAALNGTEYVSIPRSFKSGSTFKTDCRSSWPPGSPSSQSNDSVDEL